MRTWLIGIVFLAFSFAAHARADGPTAEETLAKAEAAIRNGAENKTRLLLARKRFSEATNEYLRLHEFGYRNAALYRSLGNAAVLADRWPEAIWAYQSGLKLDPNDQTMRQHRDFVRTKVLYSPSGLGRPAADSWPAWLHRLTIGQLGSLAGFLYCCAWIAAAAAFITRRPSLVLLTTTFVTMSLIAGAALRYELHGSRVDQDSPLVVLATNADFHRGNGPSYPKHPVLPMLPRGLEARQMHRRGDWLQIRLTTGETGWVHASQTLVVGP